MRLHVAAMALLSLAAPAAAFAADRSKDDRVTALKIAASMAVGDWVPVSRHVPKRNITQDPQNALVDTGSGTGIDAFARYLSTCRFTAMAGSWGRGEGESVGHADQLKMPNTIQIGWICPKYVLAEAVVSEADHELKVQFRKSQPKPWQITDLRKSGRNAEIAEGFAARSLVDPHFKVGKALKSEPVREGEPSEEELNEVALSYFSAILEPREGVDMSGLEYLDFALMSWNDLTSRKFSRIPFAEVRERLRECKLFEGWPRRYERNGERVFGFDSGWQCLGASGPYTTTLFLEIKDGRVAGGRFIRNSGRDEHRALSIPAAPQRN